MRNSSKDDVIKYTEKFIGISSRGLYHMGTRHFVIPALTMVLLTAAGSTDAHAAQTLGTLIKNYTSAEKGMNTILSTISYIAGLYLGANSIFKMKAHVENPHQTPMSDIFKRFFAGGMFLSMPFMVSAVKGSLFRGGGDKQGLMNGFTAGGTTKGALDDMIMSVIADVYGPVTTLLSSFSYIAGAALMLVGLSRLTKKMEEGPRGPGGMGTLMTFIAAGALFSSGNSMAAFSNSIFGNSSATSSILISSDVIQDGAENVQNVIRAMLGFVMLVGFIAFIRGWFVLKAFADGQSGATLAQGLTFLLGGTIAINLGDFVQALSNTLGITALSFS